MDSGRDAVVWKVNDGRAGERGFIEWLEMVKRWLLCDLTVVGWCRLGLEVRSGKSKVIHLGRQVWRARKEVVVEEG